MANWKLNNRTGMMEPSVSPEAAIAKCVTIDQRINSSTQFDEVRTLRDGLKIGYFNGTQAQYLIVRMNNNWRCVGRITNAAVLRYANGPLINFHRVWQRGVPVNV